MVIANGVLSCITDIRFILLALAGAAAGLLVGAIPGLSVTMATALLVSVTYSWAAEDAMALIMGVYAVGVFSGAVSAILINIPGAPSSVVTALDGYPLARRGEGRRALTYAAVYSFVGSVFGFAVLALLAEPVSVLALRFMPMDYFLLGLFGLAAVGALSDSSLSKGYISAALGIVISLVGLDPVMGTPRLTFGIRQLQAGVSAVPALVGLFGMAEVLTQIFSSSGDAEPVPVKRGGVKLKELLRQLPAALGCSAIGTAVGALPGAGTPVASFLAYGAAKRLTRSPSVPFGEGAVEGIAASESANNACVGGALIPTLTLGIPGDAVTAVMLSAFYVHGLRPGPLFISQNPEMFAAILAGGVLGSLFLPALGLPLAPLLAKAVTIPRKLLLPAVSVLCVVGAFSCNNRMFDVWLMLAFGLAGWLMRRGGYPAAPMILGIVLGGMMDENFRRAVSLASSEEHPLAAMLGGPITVLLLALTAAVIVISVYRTERKR